MDLFISPRELAFALGMSESSLKRWVDAGRIPARRTSGGHRRIARADALAFVQREKVPVAHPERLGLVAEVPAAIGEDPAFGALMAGDARALQRWATAERRRGATIAELCDGPLRAAMHVIGSLWQHDADGVVIEHRATDACVQLIAWLRAGLPEVRRDAPVAVGGAPEDDPYVIPSAMVALVLAEAGWRVINLGADTPTSAMHRACSVYAPKLVWVSASTPVALPQAYELADLLASQRSVIGGRAAGDVLAVRPKLRTAGSLAELLALV